MSPKRFFGAALAASALSLTLGMSPPAQAIVYTSSNAATENRVMAFDVNLHGELIEVGSFGTGGTGTGAPLGNQAALATDASDRWLFVTNAGDGTLTSFRIRPDGLEFVNIVPSGGRRPISVAVFGTLVYVLNEGDGVDDLRQFRLDNVSGFRFTAGGVLVPIPNSTRSISLGPTSPAQVGFNKSGTVLLVTEKATNTITTFVTQPDGTLSFTPLKRPSAVPTPFGFQFGDRDFVFITEANGGGAGVTASYRVDRETGEVSSLVDMIEQGDATCWTVLSSDQTIGYSINTGSDSVSLYRINFDGTLESYFRRPDRQIGTGDAPRDAVLSQNNQHLFVLNNGEGTIRAFDVRNNGAILPRGTAAIPTSATGLVAR